MLALGAGCAPSWAQSGDADGGIRLKPGAALQQQLPAAGA